MEGLEIIWEKAKAKSIYWGDKKPATATKGFGM